MGQIKNIKLHIVTDIKERLIPTYSQTHKLQRKIFPSVQSIRTRVVCRSRTNVTISSVTTTNQQARFLPSSMSLTSLDWWREQVKVPVLATILDELRLKDVEYFKKQYDEFEKKCKRGNDKALKEEFAIIEKCLKLLDEDKKHLRFIKDWSANEVEVLNKHLPLTAKPMLYLVNLTEKDIIRKKNKWLVKIKQWIDENDPGAQLIPFSAALEQKKFDVGAEDFAKFCEENKVASVLPKIIKSGFTMLQLQYFFTAGSDEVKAWTIQKGTKAPGAAGKIHTDFEKGFIMAEVMKFDDFKENGSEAACKAAGKYKQEGKQYVVHDGDIIFFKFNAGAGLTGGKDAAKKK